MSLNHDDFTLLLGIVLGAGAMLALEHLSLLREGFAAWLRDVAQRADEWNRREEIARERYEVAEGEKRR